MSLLVLDIGNTRFKWGLYENAALGAALLKQGACDLEAIESEAGPALNLLPRPQSIIGCVVAGEVIKRRVAGLMQGWTAMGTKPQWIVSRREQCGVTNSYQYPWLLGADRWAAQIGARGRVPDEAVLVVSVGTAVTIDAIDTTGHFLGGVILPGFGLMLRALEMGTAGLRVPSGEVVEFPHNTSDALMTGGTHAISGAVERMYRQLERHIGKPPKLLISGGAAPKLSPTIDLPHQHVDNLVFEGLLRIAVSENV